SRRRCPPMRIGLVGAGRIGVLHAETLAQLPEVERVVVTDVATGRARAIAEQVGAQAVDSVAELLRTGGDGVVIAAPTTAHAELIATTVKAGRPVFCEKPVASDVPGTRAVLAQVADAGAPLQVGFQRRFDAGYAAVREAVHTGRLGWLHTLRACT